MLDGGGHGESMISSLFCMSECLRALSKKSSCDYTSVHGGGLSCNLHCTCFVNAFCAVCNHYAGGGMVEGGTLSLAKV